MINDAFFEKKYPNTRIYTNRVKEIYYMKLKSRENVSSKDN